MVAYKSFKLNAQSNSIINKVSNIKDKNLVGCTRACLDHNNASILRTCRFWTTILVGLASLRSRVRASRDIAHMQMMVIIN
jgi:hypothetical protein